MSRRRRVRQPSKPLHRAPWRPLGRLGPGLVTGAADDDPGGIATHSQAGAQFGLDMLWTIVATYPLMVAIQLVSARIGRVTGAGLCANLCRVFPRPLVMTLVLLLFVANTFNIGADIAAMGAAAELLTGFGAKLFTVAFAFASLGLQLFVPYHRYVQVLKWLTMALFAYVGVAFTVHIDWPRVLVRTFLPHLTLDRATLTMVVAVFGTTISPYLFFWQSSEEVEEQQVKHEPDLLHEAAKAAELELARIRWDTIIGMGFANTVAFFIMLATAVTLHASGQTDVQTSAEAALALRPLAGDLGFVLFSAGIVGTGLLAVPVLAGSSAYAIGEARGWKTGLEHWPWEAPGFYGVIAGGVLLGLFVVFSPLDPIKALFWSAVLNGVTAVPIMAAMMVVGSRRHEMGRYVASPGQLVFGWTATALMGVAAIGMIWTMLEG
jgi:NRAMP (natural resistance-associated macrophage protein)-like metal ion transporter